MRRDRGIQLITHAAVFAQLHPGYAQVMSAGRNCIENGEREENQAEDQPNAAPARGQLSGACPDCRGRLTAFHAGRRP
ncbi:MAG: hypothetical protein ACLQNE_19265 [Thermoguttaceae bacterium]